MLEGTVFLPKIFPALRAFFGRASVIEAFSSHSAAG